MKKQPEKMWWYYRVSGIEFNGFECVPDDHKFDPFDKPERGPFETFMDAKLDAIEHFKCDLDVARGSLREIRATRKRDVTE